MKAKIEGTYRFDDEADDRVIRISRARNAWRTIYSSTGKAPRIPVFSRQYRIDIGDDLAGRAFFDNARGVLIGEFQSAALGQGEWINGMLSYANAKITELPIFGHFVATLNDDASFDVVIEQWGGKNFKLPPKGKLTGEAGGMILQPETTRTETKWRRLDD